MYDTDLLHGSWLHVEISFDLIKTLQALCHNSRVKKSLDVRAKGGKKKKKERGESKVSFM